VIQKIFMPRLLLPLIALVALTAVACGNNDTTTPTTPTTTANAAITPATTVYQVGQTQTFTMTASTTPANVIWSSSNTNVLTIDASGNAQMVGVGAATVNAAADNSLSATLSIQVVPIYQGNWRGTAQVLACTDVAGFQANGYCSKNLGTVNNVTLVMNQSGSNVTATMTKSEGTNLLNGTLTGTIGAGGDITMSGTLAGLAGGSNLQLTLISWNSLADGSNMSGTWAGNITSPQILGIATLQWSLTMQLVP